MRYLDKRVKVICDNLDKLKIKQKLELDKWQYKEGQFFRPEEAESAGPDFAEFDSLNMHWYGKDKHYWFKKKFVVPESMAGKRIFLKLATQIDEWDDAKNPQFLVFINNKIVQGMDMNHRLLFLGDNFKSGDEINFDIQAYSGILHDEFLFIASIIEIDEEVEGLYFDLWVPLAAFPRMAEDDKNRQDIEEILNTAVNFLDLRTPYTKEFYDGIKAAREYLKKALYEEHAGYSDVIATCIGHTHIDVAWWWTVAQTREKVARSFATVLKLMEEYPEYKFMSSQPQLYVFLKERYPEVYEKIKEKVKEGVWEPEGGMWLEADCNLTSGESLVRQFMHGKKFFKDEFGVDNKVLWLPDVFGYSGSLPQIMKRSGIKYFMTTKLAWNQFNKIPNDTFIWRGIDGSEIFTHMITTLGIGQPVVNFFTTYNGELHPDALMGGWERYQNKRINNDILISYGFGDGGGGPTREMLETARRMEKGVKGIPKVRREFAGKYFEELEAKVKDNKRLETWEGELYFEYHRGTYTSMARNKRSNRKSELGLMDLEFFSVLADKKIAYPVKELDDMWKIVLLNQFHDILPGSSIKEVYEVTKEEYARIAKELEKETSARLEALAEDKEGITVWNTTGHNRSDIAILPEGSYEGLKYEDGSAVKVQATKDGAIAFVENIPSKGYRTLYFDKAEAKPESPFILNGDKSLETPFYKIELDENALFSSIFDKENDREVLKAGEKGNLLRMYEDKPIYYDNWDIDIFYTEKYWDALSVEKLEWIEIGEVRATLLVERKISNSFIRQKIHFYADNRRIDFETYVDWKDNQHLLKVHFPVDIHSDEATFEIQFGNAVRKVHTNTSWDEARFESCAQKWMDFSEGHYGVALLNDCKYGHSIRDGVLGLTLIKSGIEPNPTTDQEEHFFTYALYPHAESWRYSNVSDEAYNLNQPLKTVKKAMAEDVYSYANVDKKNVVIETIKKAEEGEGTVIRLFERDNAKTTVKLLVDTEFNKAFTCDLLENEEEELKVEEAVNAYGKKVKAVSLKLRPFEVYTVKFR